MFIKLLVIFAVVPIVEMALLIKLGNYIGILATIILVASTGIIGISLAKQQGYQVIRKVRMSLEIGDMPANDLIEGLLILIGGAMLLTPGLITDITGFSFIIPFSRKYAAKFVKQIIKRHLIHKY